MGVRVGLGVDVELGVAVCVGNAVYVGSGVCADAGDTTDDVGVFVRTARGMGVCVDSVKSVEVGITSFVMLSADSSGSADSLNSASTPWREYHHAPTINATMIAVMPTICQSPSVFGRMNTLLHLRQRQL